MLTVVLIGFLFLTAGCLISASSLRSKGFLRKVRFLVFGFLLICIGAIFILIIASIRTFESFSKEKLIASVECRLSGKQEFIVVLSQFFDTEEKKEEFHLKGDQWVVSGGVVKWHPFLTALGFPSYQKLTRISGRYRSVGQETSFYPSAYDLNGGLDSTWDIFYRLDPYLPFVDAVYGSAAFVDADPKWIFNIYVNHSGYIIRKGRD